MELKSEIKKSPEFFPCFDYLGERLQKNAVGNFSASSDVLLYMQRDCMRAAALAGQDFRDPAVIRDIMYQHIEDVGGNPAVYYMNSASKFVNDQASRIRTNTEYAVKDVIKGNASGGIHEENLWKLQVEAESVNGREVSMMSEALNSLSEVSKGISRAITAKSNAMVRETLEMLDEVGLGQAVRDGMSRGRDDMRPTVTPVLGIRG